MTANNPDGKYETYHEIPSSKYFFISWPVEIAIPTTFFKVWSLFLIAFTSVSTAILCLTDWWQTLLTRLATLLFIQHWYIGWPAAGVTLLILYLRYRSGQKRKRQRRAMQARAQADAMALQKLRDLEGGDKKK